MSSDCLEHVASARSMLLNLSAAESSDWTEQQIQQELCRRLRIEG